MIKIYAEKFKEVRRNTTILPKKIEPPNPELLELREKLKKIKETNATSQKNLDEKKVYIKQLNEKLSLQKHVKLSIIKEMKSKDTELSQIDVYLVQRERLIREKREEMEALREKHVELVSQLNELRASNGEDESFFAHKIYR